MNDPCMVSGCESAAYADVELQPDRSDRLWGRVCNIHKTELENPDTKWMIDREAGKFYVGEGLLKSNEYVLLESPEVHGYFTARQFSHFDEDGLHIKFRVRLRGRGEPEDVVIVVPSRDMEQAIKRLGDFMPGQ